MVIAGYAPSLVNFRGPLLRALREHGHQVIALAPGQDSSVEVQLHEWGVHYQPIALERAGLDPRNDAATLRELTSLLRDLRPDVVLAYTIKPVVYGLIAARRAGVQHSYALITGLGYSFLGEGFKRRALSKLTQTLYRLALSGETRVIFQNPDDRQLFLNLRLVDEDQTVVVDGSGVDTNHYAPQPLPAEPVFLLVARLLKEKGIQEYVEAARMVKAVYPQARFLLAGPMDPNPSSVSPQALQQWIEQGAVEYLGELGDVRPALAQCSVYVLPSYREGTPRTVLEAMATGRAVITTDAPGCRETVQEGVNGLLVPVADVKALAKAMERLASDPQLRAAMGTEALHLARSRYDVRRVNGQMIRALNLTPEATLPALPTGARRANEDVLKRVVDVIVSATLLTLLSVPMLLLSGLVRRFLGSPVLFSQARPGLHGRLFTMYKFRTMTDARGPDGEVLPDAARLTRFGRILRATSLDELPELINVLKGDMSLVGPRPLLTEYLPLYNAEQARRHEVRPGVTGWAQVNGRNTLSWPQKFAYDIWYVDHRSLKLDLHILVLTLRKVLVREGISARGEATMPKFTGEQ